MSLVGDAIQTMGSQTPRAQNKGKQTSIGLWHSIRDWWNVPSSLRQPTERSVGSPQYTSARQKNIQLEYDLFRAIFSPDVYIYPLGATSGSDAAGDGPDSKIVARFIDTELPGELVKGSSFIHELEVTNTSNTAVEKKHIVIIHGYMAAMGYFLKNIEAIAKSYPNLVVHVIDLPGFGNSARPTFPKRLLKLPKGATKSDEIQQIIAVENWFIDKVEDWRVQKNINHFDLIGHSMGAYLSSCYLLKYNTNPDAKLVDKFILVSPMGTESSDISLINDKKLQFNHHDIASNPLHEIFVSEDSDQGVSEDLQKLWDKLGKPKFPQNSILRTLWNNNISPFQLLQIFGPLYSKLLSFWSFQRFQNLTSNSSVCSETGESTENENIDLVLKLHEYSYSIFNQYQASGELAITKLINHEIVPRIPLCDRGFIEYLCNFQIKTLWMYGDKDWMNSKGGEYCVEKLMELKKTDTEFSIVKNAGHHIYLDNPEQFNRDVIGFLGLH